MKNLDIKRVRLYEIEQLQRIGRQTFIETSVFKFLLQPFPFYHKGKNLFKIALLLFIVGFLFEYF